MKDINFSFVNLLNIVTLCVTILFIFQIYFLKKENKSNTFFSVYLINIAVILIFFLVLDLDYEMTAYTLTPLLLFSALSIGPMLWIYVKLVTGYELKQLKKHLYVPIGFGLISLILLCSDFIISDEKISLYIKLNVLYVTLAGITVFFILQNVYYSYLSLKLYKNHLKNIGNTFSYTEKVNLKWLKLLIYGYFFLIIGLVVSNLIDDSASNIMFHIILLTYVIFSGYNALKQNPIFKDFKEETNQVPSIHEENNTELFKELKRKLLAVIDEEKLYLDSSLTIHTLASKLNSNTKYVSQLINNELNKNFVMFINEYRINDAKDLLSNREKDNLTIESIGYEVGFKSKSAFNRVFKQFTSQTPTQFKQDNS
ncbi:MAG: helix-turn-helix domain-containing protein [Flavobacteriaceae bacterium]